MTTHNTQREVEELRKALSDAQSFVQDIKNGPTLYFGDHTGRTSQHSDSQIDALIDQIGRTFAILDGLTLPSVDEEFVRAARACREVGCSIECHEYPDNQHHAGCQRPEAEAAFDKADAALASVEGKPAQPTAVDERRGWWEKATLRTEHADPSKAIVPSLEIVEEMIARALERAQAKPAVETTPIYSFRPMGDEWAIVDGSTGKDLAFASTQASAQILVNALSRLASRAPRVDVRRLLEDWEKIWTGRDTTFPIAQEGIEKMRACLAKQSIPTAEVES